ncbi:MAG: hypothetical protein AB7P35_17600 [Hyphomonadaceae bacterium]
MGNVLEDALGPRPVQSDPFAPAVRQSLGPGYDWLLELARQIYRPLLGAVCVLGLAKHFLLALPAERMDEMSLLILTGLAGALAGIRAAELSMARPGR